ncbi:MAG TPA: NAD(P)/FAD-dependent oxidoreductase [Vicinamibacterales bacterium]|nr:NAD(P)/FAD-dependent oxidoreductase [Vicinamibacterales bacterium]
MSQPHVVVVGGGFGGLATVKALKRAPVRVTLIDRTNHHLFQPLLYQVATAVLSPAQIASPIRALLRRQRNASVFLGEVSGVDTAGRCVHVDSADRSGRVPYDYLVLATGVRHSYFGHDEFAAHAPGLKTVADAVAIRNRILQAFEQAETEDDPRRHPDLLTFVLIGGGPTGVEMAGAIASLIRNTLASEFRRVDPRSARIVLVDRAPRILSAFSEDLAQAAHQRLTALGVEIRAGHAVDVIDERGVVVQGERIPSRTVLWTAGVEPSPAGRWLGTRTDRSGRVMVQGDLTIPDRPEIFVIGDVAACEQDGKPLPGVAQVAMQQGRYVGRAIARRTAGRAPLPPFRYFDKGSMAVVGRNFAVMQSGRFRLRGWPAFFAWAAVHLEFLAQSSLRASVLLQWIWTYVTSQPGSRLIVPHQHASESARAGELRV